MPAAGIKSSNIEVTMSLKMDDALAIDSIKRAVGKGIAIGAREFRDNFDKQVMTPLILGGPGWYSLEQTPSWKWINSEAGFGQLGFSDSSEPLKLLTAMLSSYEVQVHTKIGKQINIRIQMKFFDIERLTDLTRHPAAGEHSAPNMDPNRSWLDWVLKGKALSEPAKFVQTGPAPKVRSSAIAGSKAGLMKNYGKGLWEVPPRYRLDLKTLVERNEKKIVGLLEKTLAKAVSKYLKR